MVLEVSATDDPRWVVMMCCASETLSRVYKFKLMWYVYICMEIREAK